MATAEQYDLELGTDETFDFLCSVCKKKNKTTEADKFCSDCQDYYCKTCVKVHEDVPAMQLHKIFDKTHFKIGTSASLPVVPTERCKEHGHKIVDMYCKQHDVVGCSTCIFVDHSDCKEKFHVPDYISQSKLPDTRTITRELDDIRKSVKKLEQKFEENKKKLTNNRDAILKVIQDFREEIRQRLDELEQNTIRQTEQQFQTRQDDIEAKVRELEAAASEVESVLDSLKSADGNLPQLFVSANRAQKISKKASRKVQSLLTKTRYSAVDVSFSEDMQLSSLLKQIETLGEFHTELHTTSAAEQDNVLSSQHGTVKAGSRRQQKSIRGRALAVKDRCKKTYFARSKSDKNTCDIVSACVLEDGTVIISDYANKNLKRLDRSKSNVKDSCDLSMQPWQVCVTGQNEVAVTCMWASLVKFVAVESKMTIKRQISTDFSCCGLAYADGKLYISDAGTSVYVYTLAGNKLQQFVKDQSGNELFSFIQSLAVKSDSSRIYIADFRKGLVVLDKNGTLVGQFSGKQLEGAQDVCLYKNGNVLVCGLDSQNLLQFSADGKLIGQMLKTSERCKTICCVKNYTELFVSFATNDDIKVYDTQ